MTHATLNGEYTSKVSLFFIKIITTTLMIFSLYLSVSLLDWAISNKQLKFVEQTTSDITAEVRERQLACLARNVYYEAGSEPFEGKAAVAQIVLNRVASGLFPDDICKTIYQKNIVYDKVICQFSWACDRFTGPRPVNTANYNQSMDAAKKVLLEGFRLPSLNNALYFHATNINPGWNRKKVATIGNHVFYQ